MNNPDQAHPVLNFPGRTRHNESRLEQLLRLEGDIRLLPNRAALSLHAVNETRTLTASEQVFFFTLDRKGRCRMAAASGVPQIDGQAKLVRALTASLTAVRDKAQGQPVVIDVEGYPFRHGYWSPCIDLKAQCFAGLLFVRLSPWSDADGAIAKRLGEAYGQSIRTLSPPSLLYRFAWPRWLLPMGLASAAALAFIPVPLRVMAPVEVVARNAGIVTAPSDGVISEIVAAPNAMVKPGDLLFRLDSTLRRSDAEVAAQRVSVARAKVEALKNGSFGDATAGHDLPIAEKELQLAELESAIAARLLKETDIHAFMAGLASFAPRETLIGKTVRAGERIMEIADPRHIEYRATLAVHDAIDLEAGAAMRVFLDTDPLETHTATVTSLSFHAEPDADGQLGYRIIAQPGDDKAAQLGARGTAQITGQRTSLGMALLRRPIAAIRQYAGW